VATLEERHLPGRQGRLLFAYLVTENGRAVPREELAQTVWEDDPPATWEKALTVLASKLRAVLSGTGLDGANALTYAFGCYRLDLPKGSSVDVLDAESAAREAESLLAAGEPEKAAEAAASAEAVVREPFVPGDEGAWVQSKRRELADIRARTLSVLAEASLTMDNATEAVRWAEQAIEAEPYRETGYRLLMTAHIAAGNRGEALRVYERCRRLLADELGTYPSPETESIYRGLLEKPTPHDRTSTAAAPLRAERPPRSGRRRRNTLLLTVGVAAGIAAGVFALTSSESAAKLLPDSVVRIDPRTLKATEVAQVGDAPDLIVASGGYLWVTNNILRDSSASGIRETGDHTLTRVDPSTGKTLPVSGGLSPCGLAADPSGDIWVASCFRPGSGETSNVTRVDAKTLRFEHQWKVPGGVSFYRGLAYGDGALWASTGDAITKINPDTGRRRTIPISGFAGRLGWSAAGNDLWVANFPDGRLTRVHAPSSAVRSIAGAGTNPGAIAADGNLIWVADWGAPQVLRMSATGAGKPQPVRLQIPERTGCPRDSCFWGVAAGAGYIWAVSPRDRAVWRINPNMDRATRIPLPYEPAGVAVAGNTVWVTVRGR